MDQLKVLLLRWRTKHIQQRKHKHEGKHTLNQEFSRYNNKHTGKDLILFQEGNWANKCGGGGGRRPEPLRCETLCVACKFNPVSGHGSDVNRSWQVRVWLGDIGNGSGAELGDKWSRARCFRNKSNICCCQWSSVDELLKPGADTRPLSESYTASSASNWFRTSPRRTGGSFRWCWQHIECVLLRWPRDEQTSAQKRREANKVISLVYMKY